MPKKHTLIETCQFIPASRLVPKAWTSWFWEVASQDAPFSWGDNNRTLVTAERLADHVVHLNDPVNGVRFVSAQAYQTFLRRLRKLGTMYIDLEN